MMVCVKFPNAGLVVQINTEQKTIAFVKNNNYICWLVDQDYVDQVSKKFASGVSAKDAFDLLALLGASKYQKLS